MPLTSITAQGAAESGGGRYRLDAELARGGMGVVYRAFDESLGRFVALKRPTADAMKKKAALALFQREFLTLSRLRHPRIIEAYEYGYDDGVPYYTMELLDGRDLRALAPLPFREACRYLRDVASSLALLHARRQLHRDVSPSNVRLTGDGRAKLIDFGAMTTFGTTGDIVGTPPSIAPEMLRRAALDQRSDLYGLGATAYWALTGRHAYPARSLADLEELWSKGAAARPSAHVHGIPSALDDLVLSLLHMDPLARPSSAAEVIERLNTIAHLESEDEAAQSYLVSPGVIGRAETSKRLGRRLVRLQHHGKGAAVLIIGHTGVGRTRLLEELGLDAQLSGLRVVAVDAESCPETYGVAGALVEGVFRCVPRAATEAAADAPLALALQFPSFGRVRSRHSHVPSDPAELRVALQTALHDWMVAVARKQRLLLLVDNLQQTDEASLALLTSLSHEASKKPLFLALTLRSGEAPVAPSAIAALEQSVEAMMLEPLQREQTHELVQALFGDVPNVGRLAAWMHDTSGGNPLSCIEFARDIVSKQIATYHDGSWVLPQSLPE
ncbi:MAG TPA: serine/threonine-protein kinase, partial [Polyangiaceae bacterium]|nr:serine/threonine-protein kinase [Polyangiaceae bacterium]